MSCEIGPRILTPEAHAVAFLHAAFIRVSVDLQPRCVASGQSVNGPSTGYPTRRSAPPLRHVATAIADLRRIPVASMVGLIVISLGLGADLVAHAGPAIDHDHGAQLSAHLLTFVGMAVVLAGVVLDSLRSTRRR
jgi:hypothetical protein